MVNVGSGNLLLQADDVVVPHKGISLAFRRTYNLQSGHDVAGTDGTPAGMFGNGWTNTLDAHIAPNTAGGWSVYDADGARYDYTPNGAGTLVGPAGQHATLTSDGGCGWFWTHKSGMRYYFYGYDTPLCAGRIAPGFYGRLYQIIGRNANTNVTLAYSFDNGYTGSGAKVSTIVATTEAGQSLTLNFADFSGHRLLQQLLRPDGVGVAYGYDAQGDLTTVTAPPNNSNGVGISHCYGYAPTLSATPALFWVASPRWTASGGTDGGYLRFTYQFGGPNNALGRTSEIDHLAFVDGVVPDGTSTQLEAPLPASSSAQSPYLTRYYSLGTIGTGATATYRDTDGHYANWVTDAAGRSTQNQVCTSTQSQQCVGSYLITGTNWDAANDAVAWIDARGFETDALYDGSGNLIAIARPSTSTAQGTFRPTTLYDYDAFNNVVASCDEVQTHAANADWSGGLPVSDSLCTAHAGTSGHVKSSFAYPSYEPFGELVSTTTAGGYTTSIAYDTAAQQGTDFGLPTAFAGDSIVQVGASARNPYGSVVYDKFGNVVCSSAASDGTATTVATYDSSGLGRIKAVGDPDDSSLPVPAGCVKTAGIAQSAIVHRVTYYTSGDVATTQTPTQATKQVSSQLTFDLDGDLVSQTSHYGDATGVTQRWYDGADRVVETVLPQNPAGSNDVPSRERYLYGLAGGGASSTLSGTSVMAHGDLFEVQKWAPSGWIDTSLYAYDAAGRIVSSYGFAPCQATGAAGALYCTASPRQTTYSWDGVSGSAQGLLASSTDPLGQTKSYAYDSAQAVTAVQYAGDSGRTPAMTYSYDADERVAVATASGVGSSNYGYDVDGNVVSITEPALTGGGVTNYAYYADSLKKGVSISSTGLSQPNIFQYAYRTDGRLSAETFPMVGEQVTYAYTGGGRPTQQTLVHTASMGVGYAVYGSSAWTYDGTGRVATYTLPAGTYSGFSYDAEDDVLGYSGYGGEAVTMSYDVRGDLVAQAFSPDPVVNGYAAWPAFQYQNVAGVTVQASSEQWDGRTGAVLGFGATTLGYDALGQITNVGSSTLTYDAEGRLTHGNTDVVVADGACGQSQQRWIQGTRAGGNIRYTYGPSGNVVQDVSSDPAGAQSTRNWHWAQNTLVYNDVNGTSGLINADGLGTIDMAGPHLTVTNPDVNGLPASAYNSTGHGPWSAASPYDQKCVEPQPVAASTGWVAPGTAVDASVAGQVDDGNNIVSESGRVRIAAFAAQYVSSTRSNGRRTEDCADASMAHLRRPMFNTGGPCAAPAPPPPPPPPDDDWDNDEWYVPPFIPAPNLPVIGHTHSKPIVHAPPPAPKTSSPPPACIPADWALNSIPDSSRYTTWGTYWGRAAGSILGWYYGSRLISPAVNKAAPPVFRFLGTTGKGTETATDMTNGKVQDIVFAAPGAAVGGYVGERIGYGFWEAEYNRHPSSLFGMRVCSP